MADVTHISTNLVPKGVVSVAIAMVLTAAVLTAAVACSGPVRSPGTPSVNERASEVAASANAAGVPVLSAEVAFPRTLQAQRWVEVQLTGARGDDWVVTSAELEATTFAPLVATASDVRLFERYVARVRVPLGVATCPAGTGGTFIKLTVANGASAIANLEIPLPPGVLAGINADECATRSVLDVASPSLGDAEAAWGTTVDTTLTVSRGAAGADASVALAAMRGSVVFDVEPRAGATLPMSLGPEESTIAVPVTFTASRCDPHVFAESKKTFVFAVWLTIDGGPEKYVELGPNAELKAALQLALNRCRAA